MTKICRGTLTIFNEKSLKFHLVTKLPEPPRAPKGSSQYWQLGSLARIIITYCSVMVLLLMIIAIVIIIMIVIIITIVIVIVTVHANHSFLCTMHSLQSKCTCELFAHPLGLNLWLYDFTNLCENQIFPVNLQIFQNWKRNANLALSACARLWLSNATFTKVGKEAKTKYQQ